MLIGEAWAADTSSGLTSVGPDSAGSPSPIKSLSAATFTLPQELGYIQESVEAPGSGKTVIHIQDAHCNYAAQKSISEILNYLATQYGISIVNCEGAAKGYDLSPFTDIPEKDIREKTADFFVKEGIVSAAEYYAVNNPLKVSLWGVEDPDLYLKNLKVYRDSLAHRSEIDRYIRSIGHILDNLKRRIYSDELLELDRYYNGYKEKKITFKEYLLYLIAMGQKRMIDIKSFSSLYLLSQTLADEDKINFKRANNEKDEVVDKLKRSLSKNEVGELIIMAGRLKAEKISQADFYAYLVKKIKSVKLDISGYPELQKYIVYISLYGAIDRTKVSKELDTLEYRIKASLYENDSQRELGLLSKNLAITKNIFNISLTRDDYIYYKEHRETFAVANYLSFIDKKAPLYGISAVLDKNIGSLDGYREKMDQFYDCSLERDKAFIKNIKFTDHDRPSSIIITGGFHTENLRELFKNEKVSYVSIMPKFTNPPGYESPYLKRLAGQRTALENVIDTAIPAVLNLQVVEILSKELALEVEGKAKLAKFRLAVAIMAALMRGEQFIFKIDKEAYPKENRPQEDKIIVFNRGEGGNITSATTLSNEPNYARLASEADALLTAISADSFAFSPASQTRVTGVKPADTAIRPRAADGASLKPVTEPSTVKAPEITPQEALLESAPLYRDAKPNMRVIERYLRPAWTLDIAPAISKEDIQPTPDSGRFDEQLLGKKGHNVHARRYLAEGRWIDNLKVEIKRNMGDFIKETKRASSARMAIRLMIDDKGTEVGIIKDLIREDLKANGYTSEEADNVVNKHVKFVPVSFAGVTHINAPVDLFVDIGMMEIDRYLNNDYPDETLPQELKDNFIALLKLSITNFDDFKTDDIKRILDGIFNIGVTLRIKPVDWNSVDQWRKANQALLQSV